jgi:hypothetical protein
MPDSTGRFKGISVPALPWRRYPNDCIHEPDIRDCPYGCGDDDEQEHVDVDRETTSR